MTEAQWNSIQADIFAIKVLLFALARTSPESTTLHDSFRSQKEVLETALLHSELSEAAIQLHQQEVSQIERAIWG